MICAWHRSERTIHHARLSIRYHYNKKRVFCQRLFGIFPQIPRERPKKSLRHIVEKLHRGVTLFTNMWYNTANDGKAVGAAMRFVNYIWDFDGTLCDSYPHTTVQFLRAMGWGMERYDEVFRRLQVTWLDAIRYYRMSEAEDRAFRAAANSFAVDPYPTLFPGCRAVLTAIREGGGRSFLYTLRDMEAVRFLDSAGVLQLFDGYVTQENRFPGKPDPTAVRYLMDTYRLDPRETVMIGDRELDGDSGKNAGCAGCLLTFLPQNADGVDPLQVTHQDFACRNFPEFSALMGIEGDAGERGF